MQIAFVKAMIVILTACVVGAGMPVLAQDYPTKPIRFVVPYPPGGGTDIIARIVQEKLTQGLGQPIINPRSENQGRLEQQLNSEEKWEPYVCPAEHSVPA